MNNSAVEAVAITLLVVSTVVVIAVFLIRMTNMPRFVRAATARRARARLRVELERTPDAVEQTVVYWDRYRSLSKLEVFAIAEEFGWFHTEQRLVPEGWALEFARDEREAR